MLRRLANALAFVTIALALIFATYRVRPAYAQCVAVPFTYSAPCFFHDVLTGEDL